MAVFDQPIMRSIEALPELLHASPDAAGNALGGLFVALALQLEKQRIEAIFLAFSATPLGTADPSADEPSDRADGGDSVSSAAEAGTGTRPVSAAAQKAKTFRMRGNLAPRSRNVKVNFACDPALRLRSNADQPWRAL